MSNERDPFKSGEHQYDAERLKDVGAERQNELAAERERKAAETSPENNVERARHEALEHASSAERKLARHESPAERRGVITKRERKASYDAAMSEVRDHMSGPSRAFSVVIHHPTIEKVSDIVGGTIARPNAILSGSLFAFLFTLAIYLVARFNGYALSGAETIASFTLGWIVGLIFDYLKLVVTGKK